MALLKRFAAGLKSLFRRKRMEQELDEELRGFVEASAQQKMQAGISPEQALREARIEMGSTAAVKDQVYATSWESAIEGVWRDFRFALRLLRRKPVFTGVAVVTLALGIGATTAIFSIVNAVLLRPLPFRDPGHLVRIFFNEPGVGLRDVNFSLPELEDLTTRADVFEQVSAIGGGSANLTGGKEPERIEFVVTNLNYFSMLGATPQIGRLFTGQDYQPGFASVVVISDGLWRRTYGADPNVIGRILHIDTDPYTIIGVLPAGFRHPGATVSGDVDVFTAAGFSADPFPQPVRKNRVLNAGAIGRLKPGLTLEQARSRLSSLATQVRHEFPEIYSPQGQWTIEIQSLQEFLVGNVRPMLLVLLGAVLLIVLIVSLNIANLLLARALGRQREMAMRQTLGATRGRMIRQMLTESVLLAAIGGAAGVLAAQGTLGFLRIVPANIPRLHEVRMDWVVLAFASFVSILTGVVFGLAPALQSVKTALSSAIRQGFRGSGYSARNARLRNLLIASELAFAVVLMIAAGLLLRTLGNLLRENPGFNPTQVIGANVWLPVPNDPKMDPYRTLAQRDRFNRELLRRMNTLPGVELAAITSSLPTTNLRVTDFQAVDALAIEDHLVESSENLRAERIRISSDYFKVIQARLVSGRSFTELDDDGKPLVAIIDETTAHRYWPDRNPLGHRIRFGQNPTLPWMMVVGIVGDIKSDGLDIDGIPHIYVPIHQSASRSLSVVLRTSLPAATLEPQIRRAIQKIDPGLPVFKVSSMDDVIDRSLASRRFSAQLVAGFAALALLLASIGIYGVLAHLVGQRSQELGVRMALGAGRMDILKLVLGHGIWLAAIGVASGLVLAALVAPTMASLLYGIRIFDPLVFVGIPLTLFLVSIAASYVPARRAVKVSPVTALREA